MASTASVNLPPVALDDIGLSAAFQTATTIGVSDILANDSDPDGGTVVLLAVANATDCTVTIDSSGQIFFKPAAGFSGDATFEYTIEDGQGGLDTATVTVRVGTAPLPAAFATNGNDILSLSGGARTLNGLGGDDVIDGSNGDDAIKGGTGDDSINGKGGDDILNGGTGNDVLKGSNGDDILLGGTGNDRLSGGEGRDVLIGGSGVDFLIAGSGDDRLEGGAGDDVMNGGQGADLFVFSGSGNSGNDLVLDFNLLDDRIQLSGIAVDSVVDTADGALASLDNGGTILFEGLDASDTAAYLATV